MGLTNDRSTKAASLVKPTALNLQPRPFAPLEAEEKDEAISRKSGYSENYLEKIINTPISESATSVQRKSGNRLKAIASERANPALQNQPVQRQESLEEEQSEGEQEEGKEFTMNPEPPPPIQRKFADRLRAKALQRMEIQAKLTIGEPNDKYEQEADDTASRVVQQINSNASITSQIQPVQRQELEENEELQMKPIVQRRENLEGVTAKPKNEIQRDGDEPTSKKEELHQDVGKKFLFKLYEEAAVAKVEFDPIVSNIASITNGTAKIPKLKAQNTAVAKSEGEYGGDHSRLVDICRASIIYNSYKDLMEGLGKSKEMITLVREKNRFAEPTPAGYRDILLNVRLSNGHIAELQLHLQAIMDVKNGVGHDLYEQIREIGRAAEAAGQALTPEEAAKVEQLVQESRIHYDAAFENSQQAPAP
jgi:hypothetical protein